MLKILSAFIAGALFAAGLFISGMTDPQKVLGFFKLGAKWDSSLLFVMLTAVLFNLVSFKLIKIVLPNRPLFAPQFNEPTKKLIDKKLIFGSALFGLGWGMVGLCPGPALVNLVQANRDLLIFVICMLIGMMWQKSLKIK